MQEHRFDWHPTPDEVARIVAELRPIIEAVARRSTAPDARPADTDLTGAGVRRA